LRLQGDEKLVALIRKGNANAFETLVQRYQPRLLAFCRHMLGSKEDAEDVLQEVFAASYNALLADDRPINARPWLYRIARNRCLNHLRKPKASGQDSMDTFERDNGVTTAETVHQREEFRDIVADVQDLAETQRTALLLREIDALSYDQIADAMETTVPSVKSLLVRARVTLAESAESRLLTCEEVRLELGHVAEGLSKSTPPVRRHLKRCERCRMFKSELRNTSKALAALFPVGPLLLMQKFGVFKLGLGASAAGGSAAAGGSGLVGGAGLAASGAGAAGAASSVISVGVGTLASKAAAGMAAAVIVTAGAVEVNQVSHRDQAPSPTVAAAATRAPAPVVPKAIVPPPPAPAEPAAAQAARLEAAIKAAPEPKPSLAAPPKSAAAPAQRPRLATAPAAPVVQEEESTATLPPSPVAAPRAPLSVLPPEESLGTPVVEEPPPVPIEPQLAPLAGEPTPSEPRQAPTSSPLTGGL